MISQPPKVSELSGLLDDTFTVPALATEGKQCLNCRFYIPLAWPLGSDYGVCACPDSPAKATMRFEHMNCIMHWYRRDELWPEEMRTR